METTFDLKAPDLIKQHMSSKNINNTLLSAKSGVPSWYLSKFFGKSHVLNDWMAEQIIKALQLPPIDSQKLQASIRGDQALAIELYKASKAYPNWREFRRLRVGSNAADESDRQPPNKPMTIMGQYITAAPPEDEVVPEPYQAPAPQKPKPASTTVLVNTTVTTPFEAAIEALFEDIRTANDSVVKVALAELVLKFGPTTANLEAIKANGLEGLDAFIKDVLKRMEGFKSGTAKYTALLDLLKKAKIEVCFGPKGEIVDVFPPKEKPQASSPTQTSAPVDPFSILSGFKFFCPTCNKTVEIEPIQTKSRIYGLACKCCGEQVATK